MEEVKKKNSTFWKFLACVVLIILGLSLFYYVLMNHRNNRNLRNLVDINRYNMVHFNLVYGHSQMNYSRYFLNDYMDLLDDEQFSVDRKTLLYVHGWIEDFESESTQTIASAYAHRRDHNIVIIDWGQYSFGEYYTVIPRFTAIAKILANILHRWTDEGQLDISTVHCVGHSFGSHIMGIMARELSKTSFGKYKIKRISGLDPAHYGFFPSPSYDDPLSPSDAEFVDVIHTDVNFIGTNYRLGHVDFYPNNGNRQPGCPPFRFKSYMQLVNSFCSHHHGWRYWAETVKPGNERIFPAVLCKDYKDFIDGKCNENPINFMGYGAIPSIPGAFYNELRSNVNFTVDDSYYLYLLTSLNYRSDLAKIITRLWQFFTQLSRRRN